MTDFVKIKGKLKWARTIKPEEYEGTRFWRVTVYPDAESLPIVEDLVKQGIKNVLKKDEEGYYISFKRPTEKDFNGVVKAFDPPKVTDKDGNPLDVLIGNGSVGVVELECYGYRKRSGKAARLFGIQVTELVPYGDNSKGF